MITYPKISPEIFHIGFLRVRWYGLMYVIGYIIGFRLLLRRIQSGLVKISFNAAETYITYLIVGMLIGARLVYCFVYNWPSYSLRPVEILFVWQGGLSFHGAAIGMVVASALFARKFKVPFYMMTDSLAYCCTPALFFGRLGNFFNAELFGRPSTLPWAMLFPTDPTHLPRHPSQLYEALTEGLLMFGLMTLLQKVAIKKHFFRIGLVGGSFLVAYGFLRFLLEFTREPDAQLGLVLGPFSMGQILCFLTFLAGVGVLIHVFLTQAVFEPVAQEIIPIDEPPSKNQSRSKKKKKR